MLDDYHCIHARDVHHVLHQLLHYLPPRLHLVILTRADPPLALVRLRVERQLTEIRADDLRFALAETRQLLQGRSAEALDEALIRSLQARSEGWVIGLQLAGVSLQSQSPAQFLAHFGGSDHLLAGYLLEEVMTGLPPTVRECLVRLALVDRFCAPLAEALVAEASGAEGGPSPSYAIIDQLVARNLFVIALDEEGSWYRFHDLFHDFLRHRLSSEKSDDERAELHRRAGAWFAQEGLIEDALRHALAAGDVAAAAELVESNLHPLLNKGFALVVLERWLNLFPPQAMQAHPGLLIAQSFLLTYRWDMKAIVALVDRALLLVQADDAASRDCRHLRLPVLNMLRGYALYWLGDAHSAIPYLKRSLDNLPDPVAYAYTYTAANFFLALAYAACDERETAHALIGAGLAEVAVHDRPELLFVLGARIIVQWQAGELGAAAAGADHVLALADSLPMHPTWAGSAAVEVWRGWAHYFLGAIAYEHNELAVAAQHWRAVEAARYRVNPGAYQASLIGLALVAQAQATPDQAAAYAKAARACGTELHSAPLLAFADALELRLALQRGAHAAALRRAQEIDTSANQSNTPWPEQPRGAVLCVLLAERSPGSLAAAQQLLAACLREAEAAHTTRQVIPLLALQALAWQAQGDKAAAVAALERALALGEPGGFMRSFLDLGAPMAALLQQHAAEHGPSAYVRQLLAAFARNPIRPAARRRQPSMRSGKT